MGLDMYLYVGKYDSISEWDEDKLLNKDSFYPTELKELGEEILEHNFMSKETKYQIGYWRKANAIHKYFVDNCADGEDDCREMYVSENILSDLLNKCNKVIEDHSKAKELLPTQSGFFFGSTDIDDWYFQNIEYTKNLIEKVLKFINEQSEKKNYYSVYYRASW